jgi:hypothetical protein
MMQLDDQEKQKCLDDAKYRLNCLMAYDLYLFMQNKYKNYGSVYSTGHILEPAIEVSLAFGRQLLEFLQIKKEQNNDKLYCSKTKDDNVTISLYNPNITPLPYYDQLTSANEIHLVRLIFLAHKSVAHFSRHIPTKEEQDSLEQARKTIFQLMLKYMPELSNFQLIWKERDNFLDAIQK